jgi:hypothetical protein
VYTCVPSACGTIVARHDDVVEEELIFEQTTAVARPLSLDCRPLPPSEEGLCDWLPSTDGLRSNENV